jgi:hypothetical protein
VKRKRSVCWTKSGVPDPVFADFPGASAVQKHTLYKGGNEKKKVLLNIGLFG